MFSININNTDNYNYNYKLEEIIKERNWNFRHKI